MQMFECSTCGHWNSVQETFSELTYRCSNCHRQNRLAADTGKTILENIDGASNRRDFGQLPVLPPIDVTLRADQNSMRSSEATNDVASGSLMDWMFSQSVPGPVGKKPVDADEHSQVASDPAGESGQQGKPSELSAPNSPSSENNVEDEKSTKPLQPIALQPPKPANAPLAPPIQSKAEREVQDQSAIGGFFQHPEGRKSLDFGPERNSSSESSEDTALLSAALADDEEDHAPRTWLAQLQGWTVSSLLHGAVLVILGALTVSRGAEEIMVLVVSPTSIGREELITEPAEIEATLPDAELSEATFESLPSAELEESDSYASVQLPDIASVGVRAQVGPTLMSGVPTSDLIKSMAIDDTNIRAIIGAKRPSLRSSDTPADAMDGVVGEIVSKLGYGDLLCVWMIDASLSMKQDRDQASQRLGKIFQEVIKSLKDHSYEFKNAGIAFGYTGYEFQAPHPDPLRLVRNLHKIPPDNTGQEKVLAVLKEACSKYRSEWTGQIQVVIFTDESGDDIAQLEETIRFCQSSKISVSVIGPTATLGRPKGLQHFSVPGMSWDDIPVDKGPDAGVPQLVQVPHWSNFITANTVPSGFGPYGLVRLSQATGGSFTIYDRQQEKSRYQMANLQQYMPSYKSAAEIEEEARGYPLRQAVISACRMTYDIPDRAPPWLKGGAFDKMTKEGYYPALWMEPAEYQQRLSQQLRSDMKYAERTADIVERAIKTLDREELEEAYLSEPSLRWKACYDLAKGRLFATCIRNREYQRLVSNIFSKNLINQNTNYFFFARQYAIRSTQNYNFLSGSQNTYRAEQARIYLQRCIENYPNTPWAEIAQHELNDPVGIDFTQSYQRPGNGVATPQRVIGRPGL